MKRVLVFTLVAPPLSFAIAFWILLQAANWAAGNPFTFNLRQVALLPKAYLIGVIPALLTATYDYVMEESDVSYRAGLTAMFAYAISYVPLVIVGGMEFTQGPVFLAVRTGRRRARRAVLLAGDAARTRTPAASRHRLKEYPPQSAAVRRQQRPRIRSRFCRS